MTNNIWKVICADQPLFGGNLWRLCLTVSHILIALCGDQPVLEDFMW